MFIEYFYNSLLPSYRSHIDGNRIMGMTSSCNGSCCSCFHCVFFCFAIYGKNRTSILASIHKSEFSVWNMSEDLKIHENRQRTFNIGNSSINIWDIKPSLNQMEAKYQNITHHCFILYEIQNNCFIGIEITYTWTTFYIILSVLFILEFRLNIFFSILLNVFRFVRWKILFW